MGAEGTAGEVRAVEERLAVRLAVGRAVRAGGGVVVTGEGSGREGGSEAGGEKGREGGGGDGGGKGDGGDGQEGGKGWGVRGWWKA